MNDIIKEADFRKQIKTDPQQGYLFFGEEDYMKKFALDAAIAAISPDQSFSFFNEIRFDSVTYSPEALIDSFMPAPMMADRKLIIISQLDVKSMKPHEVDALLKAIEALGDYDYNTLIITVSADRFDAGNLPKKPSQILQKLAEHLIPVQFEKNSPARLAAWVSKHFEHNGVIASAEACNMVIERCGRDMYNLSGEIDKLSFYVLADGRNEITRDDIVYIAIPSTEYDSFALTNAIGARRREEALAILKDMKRRRLEPIIIVSEISGTINDMLRIAVLRADGLTQKEISAVTKIHEYRIGIMMRTLPDLDTCKRMLTLAKGADAEIKSSLDGFTVIERLICSI